MAFRKTNLILNYQNLISNFLLPSPFTQIKIEDVNNLFYLKQDEQIHTIVSGNKWRKLKGHFDFFLQSSYSSIVTVGSAHSNYLHAIAYCCNEFKIPLTLYVYGTNINSTPMVSDILKWGSHVVKIERNQVGNLKNVVRDSSVFFIPEGGDNTLSETGIKEMLLELPCDFDMQENALMVAFGSGSTVHSILQETCFIPLYTLCPVRSMRESFNHYRLNWLNEKKTLPFAAYNSEWIALAEILYTNTKVLLDPVYTSRLMHAIQYNNDLFNQYSKTFMIHTGGLQAWRTFIARYPKIKSEFPYFYSILQEEVTGLSR